MFFIQALATMALALLASAEVVKRDCTPETLVLRKEWGQSTIAERQAYISAVQCLQKLPTRLPEIQASLSMYSDFTAVHVNLTNSIHYSGIFYSWHREFLHLFENALHDHCSYPPQLGIPYWNWPLYLEGGLANSPVFDGSDTSLGGNGIYDPTVPPSLAPDGETIPRGTGGGCVTTGPFADMTVSFGPFSALSMHTGLPSNWTERNLRCLQRDFNDVILNTSNSQISVETAVAQPDITSFQGFTDAAVSGITIHGGGHVGVGMSMYDVFASPQDPAFWLHHSMLDHVWDAWQGQDPTGNRRLTLNGTAVVFNPPEAPLVTQETVLSWGVLGEDKPISEMVSAETGAYCYTYV